jgi:hypothetical protein
MAALRSGVGLTLQRTARRVGLNLGSVRRTRLLPRDWTSPIPEPATLPGKLWAGERPHPGVTVNTDAQIEFIEDVVAPELATFRVPARKPPGERNRFFLHNGYYGPVDAELLYGIVRSRKPSRIVELGSGFSTLVMADACVENERDGFPCELRVYNPFPEPLDFGSGSIPGVAAYHPLPAQDVDAEVFASLGRNDILFVDTSHVVKLGGDTVAIVLEKAPLVSPGALVHFHDVFIPWEYPRRWVESFDAFPYAEQYLVHAFLAFNRAFESLCATYAVAQDHPGRLRKAIPSFGEGVTPRAFWLERTGH